MSRLPPINAVNVVGSALLLTSQTATGWPLFDEACRNVPAWLCQYNWEIAKRFTLAAFTAHGVRMECDGFQYGTLSVDVSYLENVDF